MPPLGTIARISGTPHGVVKKRGILLCTAVLETDQSKMVFLYFIDYVIYSFN